MPSMDGRMEVVRLVKMTIRERILATLHRKPADRIPFVQGREFLGPPGQVEREARNKGMGITCGVPCMHITTPHVNVITSTATTTRRKGTRITYETPVGTVWQSYLDAKPFGGAYDGIGGGFTEYLVKKPEDWDILKYMAEDTQYAPCYDYFEYFKQLTGDDGVILTGSGVPDGRYFHSPYPRLLIVWVGANRLYVDHVKYPEKVEGVLEAIAKNQEEQFPIVVNAPADILVYGDHIDEAFISPSAFEKYILPIHNRFVRMAHAQGKITAIHCDGRLDGLKGLIAELEHDIIHAVTPPPVGNLPIKEALDLWEDKVIWVNYEYHFMGADALKKHLLKFLGSIIPGYRVIMDASTERWVPLDCLRMFANIMSRATLPLTEEKIDKIEKSV